MHRAIVNAVTTETFIVPTRKNAGRIVLLCGHCRKLSNQYDWFQSQNPDECGWSVEDQWRYWKKHLGRHAICPHCGVLNIVGSIPKYLRRLRKATTFTFDLSDVDLEQLD